MSGFGYNVNGFGSFPSRGPAPVAVQYVVIAGGGGGGYYMAGGGGAGGILTGTANIEIAVAQQITVGAGAGSTYGTDNYGYRRWWWRQRRQLPQAWSRRRLWRRWRLWWSGRNRGSRPAKARI